MQDWQTALSRDDLNKACHLYDFSHWEVRFMSPPLEIRKTFMIILTERVCQKWCYVTFKAGNPRSWRLQLPCKGSDSPAVAVLCGSPNSPMWRDHKERLWETMKTERCPVGFIHHLPPATTWETEVSLPGRSFLYAGPTETWRDNKTIAVALNH